MTILSSCKKALANMPLKNKIILIITVLITFSIIFLMPVYAWFSSQRKAAEMYKIQYPNSLYINAAHREDQIFFELGEIPLNEYRKNAAGQWLDSNGDVVANKESAEKITKYLYVFSVSGSNTSSFKLQLAHTTNNMFTYKIYKATQYYYPKGTTAGTQTIEGEEVTIATEDIVPSEPDAEIVVYKMHSDTPTENPIQAVGDDIRGEERGDGNTLYYVKGAQLSGGYQNDSEPNNLGDKDTADSTYYYPDYGDNTNVHENAVAMYWQGSDTASEDSNKKFCNYYILEVTWPLRADLAIDNKETDMIYLSVKRTG